ncbi:hypothetical protein BG011_006309 [Mortierella polycephala]|uniref:Maltase n=1 Tax=Mortierella polycephala TaxID=41804 RepID=A0A9P6TZ80_9FUNG|nr:hypothetical protein BG011_006309 [Mortierella polycephala]
MTKPTIGPLVVPLLLLLTAVTNHLSDAAVRPSVFADSGEGDDAEVCSNLWGRQDCGFEGITKDACIQRQCCWTPSRIPIPWCFHKKTEDYQCTADIVNRRDCGYMGISAKECHERNCCWDSSSNNLNAPFCFLKQYSCEGYEVKAAQESAQGLTIDLELAGQGCARFGQDIPRLTVNVDFETESRIRVKIVNKDLKRYEIPEEALPSTESTKRRVEKRGYVFKYVESPFTFSITRVANDEVVFDSAVAGMDSLIYEDEYLEISSVLPDDANIYGLGEVVTTFRRDPRGTRQTMWARDAPTPVNENLYGSHPFHLEMRNGVAHGVFLRNSNGMDVIISPKKITYKVIGGVLDFTIFVGPNPTDVINQYTEVIGRPHMPPAWALGFHQSRYGYSSINEVEEVVRQYAANKLPLDGLWLDIDYMDQYRDFTYDETRYPQARMKNLASNLATNNQSMILIIDPGIPVVPGYEPYDSGMSEDVFIKTLTGKPVEGRVWPGQTYFPDFFNTNQTWAYWERQLRKTRDDIGANVFPWIDMNEPSNFCDGSCTKDGPVPKDSDSVPMGLKYMINNGGRQAMLDEKTIAGNAVHKNGLRLTDTHNLYGHMESAATHHALMQMDPITRPFILTRSSFPGTGVYAAHWTGDNWSEWSHLYFSIPGVLSFGLFGIPFTGADICGFNGNVSEELCLRWHQLGALYPFARNHNDIKATSQEPYVWTSSIHAIREAIKVRYTLLPYYYSLFEHAHRTGKPVWQPLFFQYPQDHLTLKIDKQFLLGDAIMVSPALYQGQIQVKAYFPGNGRWFDLWSHKCVMESSLQQQVRQPGAREEGERPERYTFLPAKAGTDLIPMSFAGGHVIPIQRPGLTIAETRTQPVSLIVALGQDGPESRKKLVSQVAGAGAEFLGGHGNTVEKIVVMGLNFGRVGGELHNTPEAPAPAGIRHPLQQRKDMERTVKRSSRVGSVKGRKQPQTVFEAEAQDPLSSSSHQTPQNTPSHGGRHNNRGKHATFSAGEGVGGNGVVAKKVTEIAMLNVNGAEVPFGDGLNGGLDRVKGRDPATGLAWEVNQDAGSLTLTGLKMDLVSEWFIDWEME